MFVWPQEKEVWLTMQTDHMAQAGDFAALWGAGKSFVPPRNRIGAVLAARNHDEGWRKYELAPGMDVERALPLDFLDVPREQHVEFYGRGVEFIEDVNPRAAVLVSRHATGLYLGRYGVDGMQIPDRATLAEFAASFVQRQERFQATMIASQKLDEEDVWFDYRLLQVWDRLSIFFCHGRKDGILGPAPTEGNDEGLPIEVRRLDPLTLRLSPYPFEGDEQAFPVRTFVVPRRRYRSWSELEGVIVSTPGTPTSFRAVR
jgi:hypothetical protein